MYNGRVRSPSKCISIHVWGGLGSQLFAIALTLDLKKLFPSRHFRLKLHTSGVTSRLSEIDSIFPEFDSIQIQDYNVGKTDAYTEHRISFSTLKGLLIVQVGKASRILGFINNCDTDFAFERLRPWVVATRGHYAYRKISLSTLFDMSERLTTPSNQNTSIVEKNETLAVHYRLGDLITLADKNPVAVDKIGSEIQRYVQTWNPSRIVLYSDSPAIARKYLELFTLGTPLEAKDATAAEVIRDACAATYFIGSNSKISFWIVGLRVFRSPLLRSSLPRNNQINWIQCSDHALDYSNVSEY